MILPPTMESQDYTKKANRITRINTPALRDLLGSFVVTAGDLGITRTLAVLERPFVNPGMFTTTGRALRALEATLIVLEGMGIPYVFCDSRGWQKMLLPEGLKGSPELKRASKEVGVRLFPNREAVILKHKDADGLLIAEWARRTGL